MEENFSQIAYLSETLLQVFILVQNCESLILDKNRSNLILAKN